MFIDKLLIIFLVKDLAALSGLCRAPQTSGPGQQSDGSADRPAGLVLPPQALLHTQVNRYLVCRVWDPYSIVSGSSQNLDPEDLESRSGSELFLLNTICKKN